MSTEKIIKSPLMDATLLLADLYDRGDLEEKYYDIDPNDQYIVKNIIRPFVISEYFRYTNDVRERIIEGLKFVITGQEAWARDIWQHQSGSFIGPDDCRLLFKWVLEIVCEYDNGIDIDWDTIKSR